MLSTEERCNNPAERYNNINTHAPNNRVSKYTKQKLTEIKGEINNLEIIGDFNILFSVVDRTSRRSAWM